VGTGPLRGTEGVPRGRRGRAPFPSANLIGSP